MIAILTALDSEFTAVRAHLTDIEAHSHRQGTYVEMGRLASRPDRQIALTVIGTGNLAAATLTERINAEFRPTTMMLVGVAAGLHEWTELGDVVVATRVYAYQGGRTDGDEFHARPRAWELAHPVEQAARRLARSPAWLGSLPPTGRAVTPIVHFGPVAAGEILHSSQDSPVARQLRSDYDDTVAVEMESAGFALAGHLNNSVPTVTVRGISDHGGKEKYTTDRDGWQAIAARNAAAFAVALAATLDDNDEQRPRHASETPAMPLVHNTNTARDHASVGQQVGINLGDYHAAPEPDGGKR